MNRYQRLIFCGSFLLSLSLNCSMAQMPELIPYRKGTKWGFANNKKKIILEPVYDSVTSFTEGKAGFLKDGKWGCIDSTGTVVLNPTYGHSLFFSKGLARITIKKDDVELYGYIDGKGTVVIEPKYDLIYQMTNQMFFCRVSITRKNSKISDRYYGLLDANGKEILPPVYNRIATPPSSGIFYVEKNNRPGYVDSTGKWLIEPGNIYMRLEPFSNGLGLVRPMNPQNKDLPYEYINAAGKNAQNGKQYYIAESFIGGVAKTYVKKDKDVTNVVYVDFAGNDLNIILKDYYFDKQVENGILIKKPVYPSGYIAGLPNNEDYKHATHYLMGLIDYKGKIKEEPIYEKIQVLNNRFLMGKKDKQWVLIDTKAQNVTSQPVFYDTIEFNSTVNVLKLKKDKKWGCADSLGKIFLPVKYDTLLSVDKTTITTAVNNKFGCINYAGKILIPFKYDFLGAPENGVVLFMLNGKIGVVNDKGKEIIPAKYDPRPFKMYNGLTTYFGMSFTRGVVQVLYKGKLNFIDNTGKEYWED